MTQTTPGIHHVTAIAIDPQANIRYRANNFHFHHLHCSHEGHWPGA
jgi:hypothetical protein